MVRYFRMLELSEAVELATSLPSAESASSSTGCSCTCETILVSTQVPIKRPQSLVDTRRKLAWNSRTCSAQCEPAKRPTGSEGSSAGPGVGDLSFPFGDLASGSGDCALLVGEFMTGDCVWFEVQSPSNGGNSIVRRYSSSQ